MRRRGLAHLAIERVEVDMKIAGGRVKSKCEPFVICSVDRKGRGKESVLTFRAAERLVGLALDCFYDYAPPQRQTKRHYASILKECGFDV